MTNTFDNRDVIVAFCADPLKISVQPLGHGNINDTFLVQSSDNEFVLQRISRKVFPDPLGVICNFQKVSDHLAKKTRGRETQIKFAAPVLTRNNDLFYRDANGEYWRGQSYIPHTVIRNVAGDQHAYQVGFVLAAFHLFVVDLNIEELQEPLPGFHNIERYLVEFDLAYARHKTENDNPLVAYCHRSIELYRGRSTALEEAKQAGIVTMQAIHGDPKIDNFLFDENGGAFGLLDLDTVAGGLSLFDLGDCLRSCCNSGGETGERQVHFDMAICRALLQGYFSWSENTFSDEQYSLIYEATLLISFELGVRFFTDYLRGNMYFRVRHEDDNLFKAVRQFQLTDDIKRREREFRDTVKSIKKL